MKINKNKHLLTIDYLKQHFEYNPFTGEMWRTVKYDAWGNAHSIRKLITSTNNRGYKWVSVTKDNVKTMYLVHRLAFLWMTGKHPDDEVDHINGDRSDNRWVNLRECDSFANSRNQGVRKDCTSGVRGVTFNKSHSKWVARISHKGVRYSLGYFNNFNDAVRARRSAEYLYGYHENHAKRQSW